MMSQYPIFAGYGYNIRCNTQGNHIKILFKMRKWDFIIFRQCLYKLKAYTTTGQLFIWIATVITFWVEDGNCIRQGFIRFVMVANNKVDTLFFSIFYFIVCFNATI